MTQFKSNFLLHLNVLKSSDAKNINQTSNALIKNFIIFKKILFTNFFDLNQLDIKDQFAWFFIMGYSLIEYLKCWCIYNILYRAFFYAVVDARKFLHFNTEQ